MRRLEIVIESPFGSEYSVTAELEDEDEDTAIKEATDEIEKYLEPRWRIKSAVVITD